MKQQKRKPGEPTAEMVAAIAGVSVQLVYRKLRMGKTVREIILDAAERERQTLPDLPVTPVSNGVNGHAALSYSAAQASKENALAELRHLELMQRRGELIPVEYVRIWGMRFLVEGRDILLNGPGQLRDQLASECDPVRVEEMLRAWVDRAMERFFQLETLWGEPSGDTG